jgi:hypothetical protein
VGDHLGLTLAPVGERLGPLARVPKRVRVLAERDRVAVDDPGHDRGQLARRRGHEHLVDQTQTLPHPSLLDQGPALLVPGDPDQIRVTEPLADRGCLGGRLAGGVAVALGHLPQPHGNEQVAPLDAVGRALEQALGTREPAARPGLVAAEEHVVADPERAPDRGRHVARVEVGAMSALETVHIVVVAAAHIARACEQLEVLGAERRRTAGGGQRLEGVLPGAAGIRRPPAFELVHSARHSLIIPCAGDPGVAMSRGYGLFLCCFCWFWC